MTINFLTANQVASAIFIRGGVPPHMLTPIKLEVQLLLRQTRS